MPRETYSSKARWFGPKVQQNDLVLAGLIGIALIIVQDFLVLESLSTAAYISLLAFAVSIPLLTAMVLINQLQTNFERIVFPWYISLIASMGLAASYVGTVAAFWHISWVAGVIFGASSLFGFIAYIAFWTELDKINPETPP